MLWTLQVYSLAGEQFGLYIAVGGGGGKDLKGDLMIYCVRCLKHRTYSSFDFVLLLLTWPLEGSGHSVTRRG